MSDDQAGLHRDVTPFPSKVYRQILNVEIVWTEDGHRRDWAGAIRDAVMGADWPGWPGEIIECPVEELRPRHQETAAGEGKGL